MEFTEKAFFKMHQWMLGVNQSPSSHLLNHFKHVVSVQNICISPSEVEIITQVQ